ncbi:MAG: hypothetical protein ACJATE_001250 [Bacteroidia bacterium]|jgi:hypothetical protein
MSYGMIRAWKSATEYERIEHFLRATLSLDEEYLLMSCSKEIAFVDVARNQVIKGVSELLTHLRGRWKSLDGNFDINELKVVFNDTSEVASFKLTSGNPDVLGLILIEVSNGKISLCHFALGDV